MLVHIRETKTEIVCKSVTTPCVVLGLWIGIFSIGAGVNKPASWEEGFGVPALYIKVMQHFQGLQAKIWRRCIFTSLSLESKPWTAEPLYPAWRWWTFGLQRKLAPADVPRQDSRCTAKPEAQEPGVPPARFHKTWVMIGSLEASPILREAWNISSKRAAGDSQSECATIPIKTLSLPSFLSCAWKLSVGRGHGWKAE